jgi:hypothetical protein
MKMLRWKLVAGVAIVATIAAASVACGGSGSSAPSTPAPSSTAETPVPVVPSATPAIAPACAGSASVLPRSPTDPTVNADGDGTTDRLAVFAEPGPPDDTRTYQLQLVLDERVAFNIEAAPTTNQTAAPIGGYDVDGDGRDELFAVTGNGAYTTWIDMFEFDPVACALVGTTRPGADATPPLFAVGASVGNGGGVECQDQTIIETTFSRLSETPLRYGGKATTYRLVDNHLEVVPQGTGEWSAASVPANASSFTCGSLRLLP